MMQLRSGVACMALTADEAAREVCLESFPLGDGQWHTLRMARYGHNLIIAVDDGDGWKQNATLASLHTDSDGMELQDIFTQPPTPLQVDKKDGVLLGGIPEFVSLSLVAVHDDLTNSKKLLWLRYNTFEGYKFETYT